MANAAEYRPTPLQRPDGQTPWVDPQTGLPTPHGLMLFQSLREHNNAGNRLIPCTASGQNVITLTPNDASPKLEGYRNHDAFVFVAEQTSDGSVTATVVPESGSLDTLKAYVDDGATQAGLGDVVADSLYLAFFADHLDSGNGGLVLK